MKTQEKFRFVLHIIFLLIMIFAVVWGLCMFSADKPADSFFHRTDLFWVRLLWFQAITAVVWYACTGNYLKKILSERKQTGAINVVAVSVCIKASIHSLIIWSVGCFLPTSASWQGWVWLAQFIVVVYNVLVLFLLPQMRNFQNDGMDTLPAGVKTPDMLVNELLILENSASLSENDKRVLKKIREKIKYSIPRSGKISTSENYKQLVWEIENFSKNSTAEHSIPLEAFEELIVKKILIIQSECKH